MLPPLGVYSRWSVSLTVLALSWVLLVRRLWAQGGPTVSAVVSLLWVLLVRRLEDDNCPLFLDLSRFGRATLVWSGRVWSGLRSGRCLPRSDRPELRLESRSPLWPCQRSKLEVLRPGLAVPVSGPAICWLPWPMSGLPTRRVPLRLEVSCRLVSRPGLSAPISASWPSRPGCPATSVASCLWSVRGPGPLWSVRSLCCLVSELLRLLPLRLIIWRLGRRDHGWVSIGLPLVL
jgi:hypothetical protein